MSDFIDIPSAPDVDDMTPEEYRDDLKKRYYDDGYNALRQVKDLKARIEELREEAAQSREQAQALDQDAESKRDQAKAALKKGKDAESLFEEASDLEQKADHKRSIAATKKEAAHELKSGALEEARAEEEQKRTDALRQEQRERLDELMDALGRFEEAFRKAKAVDDRTSDGDATLQKVLSGVDLSVTRKNGASIGLADQIRRKAGKVAA